MWEALRHLIGAGGLIAAAVVIGLRFSDALRLAGFGLGTTAATLVIEVFVVAAAAGLGAWPTWIFVTWAAGMVLVALSFYSDLHPTSMSGLGSILIALALSMFVIRHFADAQVGVMTVLFLGIAGALLTGFSSHPGDAGLVEPVGQVDPAE